MNLPHVSNLAIPNCSMAVLETCLGLNSGPRGFLTKECYSEYDLDLVHDAK